MRKYVQITLALTITLSLLGAASLLWGVPAQAGNLLAQPLPNLQGYKIYFTESNGEASRFDRSGVGLSRLGGLLWQLGAEMETLQWIERVPEDADLVIMAGPNGDLSADATARLWSYLESGGRLLLLADPAIGRGRNITGLNGNTPLMELLWTQMGIRLGDGALVTEHSDMPGLLVEDFIAENLGDHPVTAGVDALTFFRARPVLIDTSIQPVQNIPLAFSPSDYYGEVAFTEYLEGGATQFNVDADVARGRQAVAAASEHEARGTRVVLVGNRALVTNDGGLQTSPPRSAALLYPDNLRFLLNAIAWLIEADVTDTQTLEFPTPAMTATPTVTPTPLAINADLAVSIAVNDPNPAENDAVIVDITIVNNGPERVIGSQVQVTLPENARFVSAGATTRQGLDAGSGNWNVGDFNPGDSGTLSVVLQILPGTTGTSVTVSAEASAVGLADPAVENNNASIDIVVAAGG